jgi:hypothetical protein
MPKNRRSQEREMLKGWRRSRRAEVRLDPTQTLPVFCRHCLLEKIETRILGTFVLYAFTWILRGIEYHHQKFYDRFAASQLKQNSAAQSYIVSPSRPSKKSCCIVKAAGFSLVCRDCSHLCISPSGKVVCEVFQSLGICSV